MQETTSSLRLNEAQTRHSTGFTRWSSRVTLLLVLIVSCACEAIAAKPTPKSRHASAAQSAGTLKESRAAFVMPRSFEYHEPFLPRDLLGAAVWGAYVALGLIWFGSGAPKKSQPARSLATRV